MIDCQIYLGMLYTDFANDINTFSTKLKNTSWISVSDDCEIQKRKFGDFTSDYQKMLQHSNELQDRFQIWGITSKSSIEFFLNS